MEERRTDFLYASPSFLEGIARVFDLGGTLNEYNNSPTPRYADGYAIGMDWCVVGKDIQESVSAHSRRYEAIRLNQ